MLESGTLHGHSSTKINGSWNQEGILSSYQKLVSEPYSPSSLLSAWSSQIVLLGRERQVKRIGFLLLFNLICFILLLAWCSNASSMALRAYTFTVGFNLLSLLTCVLSIWVERNGPTPLFTFGYERFEVLAVFASTVLAQLGSLFIGKESIERLLLEQPEIHTGRLMLGTGVAFISHVVVIYGCNNAALDHVIAASSSSWLQEHVSDISQSICSVVPVLSGLLLPRINPMLLVACAGAILLFFADLLIQLNNCYLVDTLAAICIAIVIFATMLPMSIYSGKVLLQTTPSHVVGQLDKCLRETLTIDGVLEFRNEHFWTLSFGKMAGSLQVRVRRDADEQLVLAHVVDRLSNLVSVLTVQVFKDDWAMRKTGASQTTTNLLPLLNNSLPHSTSISFPNNSSSLLPVSVSNPVVQNGSTLPQHHVIPMSQAQCNILPAGTSRIQTTSYQQISYNSRNSKISMPPVKESSQRITWNYPVTNSHYASHNENLFIPHCSASSVQSQVQTNNLLISGVRTLDAEQFVYHPR